VAERNWKGAALAGAALVLAAGLLGATPAAGKEAPKPDAGAAFTLMPLGDDITEGDQGHDSYRYWLFKRLHETGYRVSFVGSQKGNHGGAPLHSDFDQAHEGHWRWTTADALAQMDAVAAVRPQYVVITLGLGDLDQVQVGLKNMLKIIDGFRKANSRIAVVPVQAIAVKGFGGQVTSWNKSIVTEGKLTSMADAPVVTVSLAGFDPAKLTYDGVHPNEDGEKFIADRVFAALQPVMDHEAAIATHSLTGHLGKLSTFMRIGDYGGISAEIDEMLAGGGLSPAELSTAGDLLLDIGIYAGVQRGRVQYLAQQRRYYLAGPILERLAGQFRGVPVGHEALDQLAAWQKNPGMAKELAAGAMMSEAEHERTVQAYLPAYRNYQTVAAKFPGTQAAAEAQRLAADLEKRGLAKGN
jgi:hypothetical protein